MISSFILTLREGLEAALVISLVLGGLKHIHRSDLNRVVWQGAIIAFILSVLAAVGLNILGADFKDPAEAIFEGLTMLLAAGILTWMIFWMQRQARSLKRKIETSVQDTMITRGGRGLFFLSFLAVIREGLELALYLMAVRITSSPLQTLSGAILGLATAVVLGWLLFASTHRFNLRRFFQVTNILLVIFAAGLVANSAHELIIAGWIPAGITQLWNLSHILDDQSVIGQVLNTLVGYNSQPSFAETLAYLGYLVLILAGFLWRRTGVPAQVLGSEPK
jgi:high-affinity iron transporter